MPNNKQAEKRVRLTETRRAQNKVVRTAMRSAIKTVVNAENADTAVAAMPAAMKRIDKAAKKNIIHENAAARYKARLDRVVKAK